MTLARALLLLPLLASGLQGCVAAVIPLAAAGAMTTAVRDRPETPGVETRTSIETTELEQVEVDARGEASGPGESPALSPALSDAELLPETRTALLRAGLVPGADVVAVDGAKTLPTPTVLATNPQQDATYAAFADYALEIAAMNPLEGDLRQSALLSRPGSLTPDRAACDFADNAVLIDLDPATGELETDTAIVRPALTEALARLREAGVEIVWSTSLTADRAGDVRNWLASSELDPEREDRLLLLRYPEDRKQTRRQEAGTERCLVAMLGDERADFDELFDYLKRPDAAIGLDAMLGQGWFLAPVSQANPMTEGPEE